MSNLTLAMKNKPETINFEEGTVEHPLFEQALMAINSIHRTHSSNAKGMILTGEPGLGKTRLIQHYRDLVGRINDDIRDYRTVLIVETPAIRRVRDFYEAMLDALGESDPSAGTNGAKKDRIKRLFDTQGVELVVFDEAHNLLPGRGEGLTSTIANTIKMLMNLLKRPMIMAGEPDTVILKNDHPAIKSRFSGVFTMAAMNCSTPEDIKYFQNYLKEIELLMVVPTIPLNGEIMVLRMYLATGGIPREIRKLIVSTMEFSDLSQRLTLENYALGFDIEGSNPLGLKFNPFRAQMRKVRNYLANKAKKL
ncbi:TniB family NTP-binding protein [Neptunomonas qingdaonensis]|uniref:TniB protein n=1 Tax=Neptunomonas qingdaonensis TaxID=1045558 RepID=A0A1I2QSW3_9GAMM|nr:TniB family NTP-binding protein [Neptunomonas qingdaonensis]SFG30339.1 TniB protein [Neptunomonas qingdaonensis]